MLLCIYPLRGPALWPVRLVKRPKTAAAAGLNDETAADSSSSLLFLGMAFFFRVDGPSGSVGVPISSDLFDLALEKKRAINVGRTT